jgi:hypothetical protein
MAWVERIENHSGMFLTLLQNDPTWHPVINGHQYAPDEPIRVAPGTNVDCSFFVIPWQDFGRLEVQGPGGTVTWKVGPVGDGDDFLKGSAQGAKEQQIELGPRGNQFICTIGYHLVATDTEIQWLNPRHGGEEHLIGWAEQLFRAIFGGGGNGGGN